MAIKDLVVAFQGDEGSAKALSYALQMGAKYAATVTGVHVHAAEQHYESQVRRWIAQDVLDMMRKAEQEAVQAIEQSFRDQVGVAGGIAHDWITLDGPPSLLLARMSRYFDILITGQFGGAVRHGGRAVQPEELVLRSGKPIIMVPESYSVRPFKEEAVIAWDGSRSAARALTDAMQILETKRKLEVVTVEGDDESRNYYRLGDHDIIQHLERHGIEARRVSLKRAGSVGRTILEYCGATDPDILVMGAFGRGKLGDMFFGGVARSVLEHQTVPVLISH